MGWTTDGRRRGRRTRGNGVVGGSVVGGGLNIVGVAVGSCAVGGGLDIVGVAVGSCVVGGGLDIVGVAARTESSRRCYRRDQILLLHLPPPIRPRSTIPRRQDRTRRLHRTTRTTTTRWHRGTTMSRPSSSPLLPPGARGEARHAADATSATASDPSSAGGCRPTIPSSPMCRPSPPRRRG